MYQINCPCANQEFDLLINEKIEASIGNINNEAPASYPPPTTFFASFIFHVTGSDEEAFVKSHWSLKKISSTNSI